MIRSDMGQYAMLGKYMYDKEFGKICRSNHIMGRDENSLLGEAVHHYENSGKPFGGRRCLMKSIEIEFHRWVGTGS